MIIGDGARALLKAAGLMEAAREARGLVSSLPWVRDNSRFWLRGSPDGLPLPPLRLVRSSTGTSSLAWLLHGGALAAQSIRDVLETNGIDLREIGSILDFGCGCGRVVRQWVALGADVHGCDYNASAVEWCRAHLTFASFSVNSLAPPLAYDSDRFDLVYALSVFTHLPEPLLFAWLRELHRIVKPGGLLIASTHGEACAGALTPGQQAQFRAGHAVVRDEESPGTNRCGVYVPERYVRERFAEGFCVVDFLPQGAKGNPPQDLTLLRKMG